MPTAVKVLNKHTQKVA